MWATSRLSSKIFHVFIINNQKRRTDRTGPFYWIDYKNKNSSLVHLHIAIRIKQQRILVYIIELENKPAIFDFIQY